LETYHRSWLSAHPDRTADWLSAMLAEGFHVHHVDGDHGNEAPSNLVLIEHDDHLRLHGRPAIPIRKLQRDGIAIAILVTTRNGRPAMTGSIGWLAERTVEENEKVSPRWIKWRPFVVKPKDAAERVCSAGVKLGAGRSPGTSGPPNALAENPPLSTTQRKRKCNVESTSMASASPAPSP
jgi:HNH endonuclease